MQNLVQIDSNNIPFGKVTKWFTTHVDASTGHIFCHLAEPSIAVKYERLEQSIDVFAKAGRLEEKLIEPTIGELVLAQYSVNNKWYRSQITQTFTIEQEVEVIFLDYGNSEVIPFSKLRELPQQFSILPPHAKECTLAEIEPSVSREWSEKEILSIKNLVLEQELQGIAVGLHRNYIMLKLYADYIAKITVGEQLLSGGLGQVRQSKPRGSNSSSIVRSNSVSSFGSSGSGSYKKTSSFSSGKTQKKFKQLPIAAEQYIDVSVVYLINIGKFFCQLTSMQDEFNKLQEKIQSHYSSLPVKAIEKPKIDSYCCAQFAEDNLFYRGIIKKLNNSTSCDVYFIDYGNTETIALPMIKEVQPDFKELPAMAVECSLSGVSPHSGSSSFSCKANKRFEELATLYSSMVAYVSKLVNRKAEMILYDREDTPVSKKLIDEELVISSDLNDASMVVIQSDSTQSAPSSESNVKVKLKYVQSTLPVGNQEFVYVSYSYNPYYFFINLVNTSEQLSHMMSEIKVVYDKSMELLKSPVNGQPCIAKFSEDSSFYRAEISAVAGEDATVLFVDYGNSEIKPVKELCTIRKEFIKLPKQGIKCKLADIEPSSDTFSAKACQRFEELTLDKKLMMEIVSCENDIYTVRLTEINESNQIPKVDIAEALVSSGFVKQSTATKIKSNYGEKIVSNDRTYPHLTIDTKDFVDVVPVVIVDPSHFCCHIVGNAADFKVMTGELNKYYQTTKPENVKWQKMMPCVACYEEDNCWYRATVLSLTNSQTAEVVFVDFGNSAIVPFTALRAIHEYFLKLPMQMFVCSLADVKPKGAAWNSQAVAAFQEYVQDQHLVGKINLKASCSEIVLYDSSQSPAKNISQWLIDQGYAVPKESGTGHGCGKSLTPNDKERVLTTMINSPSDLYVQLVRVSSQLDEMMDQLHTFYSDLKPSDLCLAQPVIGQYCCAKFTEDDGYYRAVVEEVEGTKVCVHYIDYGNQECIDIERLKVLDPEFEVHPAFAVHCKLSGCPVKGSDEAVKEILADKELDAVFDKKSDIHEITLRDGEKNLNDEIRQLYGITNKSIGINEENAIIPTLRVNVGDLLTVYFVEGESPNSFYCQPVQSESKLNVLMEEISNYIAAGQYTKGIGKEVFCLCQFSQDSAWYRGEVKDTKGNSVVLLYCDYGNEETVESANLVVIPENFTALPKQAIRCSLANSRSDQLAQETIDTFNEKLSEKVLNLKVMEINDGVVSVELLDEELKEELERVLNPQSDLSQVTENIQLNYSKPDLSNPQGYCSVVQLNAIEVQLSTYETELNELMIKLSQYCPGAPLMEVFSVGAPCAAIYSEDNQWYRAEVIDKKENSVKVKFVDYGNTEEVAVNSLKQLSSEHLKLPRTCVSCVLHDVSEKDIEMEKSSKWLQENLIDQAVRFEVVSAEHNKLSVYLYLNGEIDRINDTLYAMFEKECHENETEVPAIQAESEAVTKPQAAASKSEEEKQKSYSVPSPTIANEENVTCYVVETATTIKCQLVKYQEKLDLMMSEIADVAESLPCLSNCENGKFCIAKYSVDGGWYRGCIVSTSEQFEIEFIDYGDKEIVNRNDVKLIPENFCEIPQSCITVQLHDVNMDDIDDKGTKQWLENKVEQQFKLQVMETIEQGTVSAYVYEQGSEGHINDQIYKLYAIGEDSVPDEKPSSSQVHEKTKVKINYLKPQITSADKGYCTYVKSASEIMLQLCKYEDDVVAISENVATAAETASSLTDPQEGDPCLALYSEDDQWYRGLIQKIEDSNVSVLFVDYGNTETVAHSNLKSMNKDLLLTPQTCIYCKLADVNEEDLDVTKVKTFLETAIKDQCLMLTFNETLSDSAVSAYVSLEGNDGSVNDNLYDLFALPKEGTVLGITSNQEEQDPDQKTELITPVEVIEETQFSGQSSELRAEAPTFEPNIGVIIKAAEVAARTMENVICFVVESALVLKVQLCKYNDQLNSVMDKLAEIGPTSTEMETLHENQYCLAKYAVDEGWYRGRVKKCDNVALVEFVDYGNTEIVPLCDVRVIKAPFATVPQCCVTIKLHGVHSEDIDEVQTKQWLDGKLEHTMRAEIVEIIDENQVSAYLYDEGKVDPINDQIYELFALGEKEFHGDSQVGQPDHTDFVIEDQGIIGAADEEVVESVRERASVFLPPEFGVPGRETGYCTHVESAVILKCQLSRYENDLHDLAKSFPIYAADVTAPSQLAVGDICLAKYSSDDNWYRAQILKVTGEGYYVEFIDYANTDLVQKSDVRDLISSQVVLPRTCIDVRLQDVHVTDIDISKAKIWLETKLIEQVAILDISSRNGDIVEAYVFLENGETSINDQLYSNFALEEHAASDEEVEFEKEISEKQEPNMGNELTESKESLKSLLPEIASQQTSFQQFKSATLSSRESVLCTHVESCITIHCQLSERYKADLQDISLILLKDPPNIGLTFSHIQIGKALLAKSLEDETWYRGCVSNIDESGITVSYVDFGNKETLPPQNLAEITHEKLLEVPATCIQCLLQDVFETDIEVQKTKSWLEANIMEKNLLIQISESTEETNEKLVYAYYADKQSEASINDQIYELFPGEEVEIEENQENGKVMENQKDKVTSEISETSPREGSKEFCYPQLSKGSVESAECTVVEKSNTIKCQLTKCKDQLEKLMATIASMNESLKSLAIPKENMACIAPYHQDLCLYRAKILSVSEATSKVEFVDYGNIDDVINEDFRAIPEELLKPNVFCVECVLFGVNVLPEYEDDAVEYLNRTVVEDTPEISLVVHDLENNIATVTLKQNSVNINEFLQGEYGLSERFHETEINLDDKIQIFIPKTQSLASFGCQLANGVDDIKALTQELTVAFGNGLPLLKNFAVGTPCCAIGDDNLYYRSVIENLNNDLVTIRYVDFGIIKGLRKDRLYKLPKSFLLLPAQGFRGSLYDLQPFGDNNAWTEEAINYFNTICRDAVLNATVLDMKQNVVLITLTKDNGDTLSEHLTQRNLAKCKERRLSNSLEEQKAFVNGYG